MRHFNRRLHNIVSATWSHASDITSYSALTLLKWQLTVAGLHVCSVKVSGDMPIICYLRHEQCTDSYPPQLPVFTSSIHLDFCSSSGLLVTQL